MGVPFHYLESWLGIVSLDFVERCSVTVHFTLLKDVQMFFLFYSVEPCSDSQLYSVEGCINSCSILLCWKSTGDCFIFTLLKGVLWLSSLYFVERIQLFSILLCWTVNWGEFHFTLLKGLQIYTRFLFFFTIERCAKTPFYSVERCAKSCSIWLLKGVQRVVPLDFVEMCMRGCILLCWKVG